MTFLEFAILFSAAIGLVTMAVFVWLSAIFYLERDHPAWWDDE